MRVCGDIVVVIVVDEAWCGRPASTRRQPTPPNTRRSAWPVAVGEMYSFPGKQVAFCMNAGRVPTLRFHPRFVSTFVLCLCADACPWLCVLEPSPRPGDLPDKSGKRLDSRDATALHTGHRQPSEQLPECGLKERTVVLRNDGLLIMRGDQLNQPPRRTSKRVGG